MLTHFAGNSTFLISIWPVLLFDRKMTRHNDAFSRHTDESLTCAGSYHLVSDARAPVLLDYGTYYYGEAQVTA